MEIWLKAVQGYDLDLKVADKKDYTTAGSGTFEVRGTKRRTTVSTTIYRGVSSVDINEAKQKGSRKMAGKPTPVDSYLKGLSGLCLGRKRNLNNQ